MEVKYNIYVPLWLVKIYGKAHVLCGKCFKLECIMNGTIDIIPCIFVIDSRKIVVEYNTFQGGKLFH